MDSIKLSIEGLDGCLKLFDDLPENVLRMEKASMRKASAAVSKNIRKGVPKRFRKLVKYKMYEDRDRNTYVLIGLYNRKEIAGNQPESGDPVFDWFKAYWANYGTLARRDKNHKFKYGIKPKSAGNRRRQSVGQPAQNFFAKAISGWENVYVETLEKEMKKNEDKLYGR